MLTQLIAQADTTTTTPTAITAGPVWIVFFVLFVVGLFLTIIEIAALWKIFTKAGEKGWKAIIPIWNLIVLLRIVGRPLWWLILFVIPLVSVVVAIIVVIDLATAFGKRGGFGVGLLLLGFIFFPILGFGSARYQGLPGTRAPAY